MFWGVPEGHREALRQLEDDADGDQGLNGLSVELYGLVAPLAESVLSGFRETGVDQGIESSNVAG